MRLTSDQQSAIRNTATEAFGDAARIWLLGSRVDDNKRDGDIDLLIETSQTDATEIMLAELRFLTKLKMQLGNQKIDVLIGYLTH